MSYPNSKPSQSDLIRDLELHQLELEVQNRELQESQRLLEASRNHHRDLYDNAPVGYLTLSQQGLIEECNYTAACLFQTETAKLRGRILRRWIHHADREILTAHLCRCANSDEFAKNTCELRLQTVEGAKPFTIQLHSVRTLNAETGQKTFRTAVIDVSDRKRAEDAEAANRAKSAFLANMSHEIRTPLGAILGFVRCIESGEVNNDQKAKYLEVIRRNGDILTRLIDDILDLSKVEANCMELEKTEFSLVHLLAELSDLLVLKASEKSLSFTIQHENLPEKIASDPVRIRQILLNMVGNALKFTDKGSVRLTVNAEALSPGHQKIVFTITDSGRGITEHQRSRLFQNFSQADSSTTRKYGGTGLGLALSQKLAHALGGDIVLTESTPGLGSTFAVTILVDLPAHSPLVNAAEKTPLESAEFKKLHGVHVLLVEDSPDNQMLIEHFLNEAGAKVDCADNGREGVHCALKHPYDLVLMDVQMPVMDGHEATRELRHRGFRTPIVALSAHAMKEDREKSMNAGCNFHMTKPINPIALTDAVKRFANRPNSLNN